MNRKQYEAMRKKLMDEAQKLLDEGNGEEAQAKMDEVKELDEKWDAIAQAQADFNALTKEPKPFAPMQVNDAFSGVEQGTEENDAVNAWKSQEYENAWAKTLMGKQLSDAEDKTFRMVNEAFTHNTENTSIVIPNTVARGIWEMAGNYYPYFADVTKTYVNGVFSMIQEDTSSKAGWYDEDTETEDGKETFKEFKLTGCELYRSIKVSWKLKEMAVEDFIPYIQRKMAKKMGAAAGYGVTNGKGASAASGKPEPMGVVTALKAEENTPQVVTYPKGTVPKYQHIVNTRALIKSGYGARLNIYANSATIWSRLAAIVDENGSPIFVPDPTNNGGFKVLGMPVKEDDSMEDGEILMSDPSDGYHMNINKEVSMMTDDNVKKRTTDYVGYAIMDGNVTTNKAHALLTEAMEG